jgi:hypothetical protein
MAREIPSLPFPERTFKMLYMWLAHLFETIVLDQLDNPAKPRPHIGWERLQLISNAVSRTSTIHPSIYSIAFLQYRRGDRFCPILAE